MVLVDFALKDWMSEQSERHGRPNGDQAYIIQSFNCGRCGKLEIGKKDLKRLSQVSAFEIYDLEYQQYVGRSLCQGWHNPFQKDKRR